MQKRKAFQILDGIALGTGVCLIVTGIGMLWGLPAVLITVGAAIVWMILR